MLEEPELTQCRCKRQRILAILAEFVVQQPIEQLTPNKHTGVLLEMKSLQPNHLPT